MCLENPSVQFYFRTGLATLSMPFRVLAGGALANHMKLTPGGRWAFSAQVRLRPKFKNGIFFVDIKQKKWPTDTCKPLFSGEDEIITFVAFCRTLSHKTSTGWFKRVILSILASYQRLCKTSFFNAIFSSWCIFYD